MKLDTDAIEFQWTDALLLGFGPIDEIHEACVNLVASMLTATDPELGAMVDAFCAHAHFHFGEEDRWMIETSFPARECHMQEHAAVLRSAESIKRRVAGGDFVAARRLALELKAWFPRHAHHLDSALAHWMFKLKTGGKPVVLRRHIDPLDRAPDRRLY